MNWITIFYPFFLTTSYCHANEEVDTSHLKFIDETDEKFQEECLNEHAKYRKRHHVKELKLDEDLVEYAKVRCINIAQGINKKNFDTTLGENRFSWYADTVWDATAKETCHQAAETWYEPSKEYNYDNPEDPIPKEFFPFTQMVWKTSKWIGCARCISEEDGTTYTQIVCSYKPKGNTPKKFKENVL